MQQYRFNFSLFIGLLVGTLICAGAVYGIWRFQIGRKSGWLLSEAEKSLKANDLPEAGRYFSQYLTIHPKDDDVRLKLASVNADISKSDEATMDDLSAAVRILEATVRDPRFEGRPEAQELRRRLVELYGRDNIARYPDALEHLSYLLETNPNDADLQALKATYLARSGSYDDAIALAYKLIGYDPETDAFDSKKAIAAGHVELYANLAANLRGKKDKPELADRIMEQLVEVNPKSAKAHLARGRYLTATGNKEDGRTEIEKAHQLAPDDVDTLQAIAEVTGAEGEYEEAAKYLAAGKEKHPSEMRFYLIGAGLQMQQSNYEKALAEVSEGIEKVKGASKIPLMISKVQLQIGQKDIQGAEQSLADIEKSPMKIRPDLIDFYRARIMMEQGNFFDAAEALIKLRPKITDTTPERIMEVDYYLGWCNEKLGRPDMAIEAYDLVLQQDPKNAPALAGKTRALAQRGLETPDTKEDPWTMEYTRIMKLPKEKRDWSKLDELLVKAGDEQKWDAATLKTRQAQLMAMREDFDSARKLLTEALELEPKNLTIQRMLIQVDRLDPKVGPAKALERWEKTVAELGDQPALRLDKADIIIASLAGAANKDELKAELAGMFAGIDNWTPAQKAELWGNMAGRYLNLGLTDEARQYLSLAADAQPHELPLRLSLFALALDSNDDAGMKDAQDKILKIVGNNNDSAWLYTEARRKLSLIRRGQLEPEAVNEIRILVNRALEQRPDWHDLHVLNAELELASGNLAKALQSFDRAQELGRPYPAATAQHIRLLGMAGRFEQAGQLLDRLPEALRYPLLGQLYPEVLFRTDRVAEAIKQARTAAETNPTSPQAHYWYSQLLARAAVNPKSTEQQRTQAMDLAVKEMRRAIELQPEFPEAWLTLIAYYSQLKDMEQAQAVLREAQLALSGDNLQIFLAKSYESLGRWFDAETMYRALHESAPDDISRTQQLAAFYTGPIYQRPDKALKVTPLLNKILRAGADKKIAADDPSLLWARRTGATMLASTGDYQNILKAEKLLASNSKDGALTLEDRLAMAEILAGRPEPFSRKKAIALLEEIASTQPLSEKGEVMLGELYFATGEEWRTYARQMETAIARFPNSLAARAAYVKNLLQRGDKASLDRAAKDVTVMRKIAPQHFATFENTVRVLDKLGKRDAARAELLKLVPDLSQVKEMPDAQADMLGSVAALLVELGDLDNAEKIYRDIAARNPNRVLQLANFLGTHRSLDQCFEKLGEIYSPERIPALVQVALVVSRKQRDKGSEKFDSQIQQWLDTGLRENPDSITLLIDQADFYDLQKRYADAAKVYRDLLQRKDLTGIRRAIVLNNLAFLEALTGSSDIDALKLVNEAAEIMGPNADILDTRAVVHIARKEYQQAVEDLELSVTDNPTASKYFHKAHAHLMAQENRAAVEAWEKAEALGLNLDALNLMEHQLFGELKAKIDQIRGASVTQAEGLRRAG